MFSLQKLASVLEQVGFTKGESSVYLALLELGESKVGPIITNSHISRSKVYDILERLVKKSVVSKFERNGVLFYHANPPHALLNMIQQREERLREEEHLLREFLPQFSSLKPKRNVQIVVYEGFEGFKAMIDRTVEELTTHDVYEVMGISHTTEAMRHYAKKIYAAQRIKRFLARSIFDEQGAYKIAERKTPGHEIRLLPSGWHTPSLFTVYGDTVGIHVGKEKFIVSVVIKNKEIADSFRVAFLGLWKISKKI